MTHTKDTYQLDQNHEGLTGSVDRDNIYRGRTI